MRATGQASGKVILLGEHAVVYGVPALAAGISRGARAVADLLPPDQPSELHADDQAFVANPTSRADLDRALAALMAEGTPLPSITVSAETDLPIGGGLGSSAALGVAIARAALACAGRPAPTAEVIARATAWERVFHGNPSGIDTTAAAIGGCFRFTRPATVTPILAAKPLQIVVAFSGVSSSTRTMVEGLKGLRDREPQRVDRALAEIARLVGVATEAIAAGDTSALGHAMDDNQTVLADIGISCEIVERLCSVARGAGALGAKLTGKGGGGSVLALVDSDSARTVLSALRGAGFEGFETQVAARTLPA